MSGLLLFTSNKITFSRDKANKILTLSDFVLTEGKTCGSRFYCKYGNFRQGFNFMKFCICEVSCEIAKSLCRLLIEVNHALVANC